MSQTVMLGDVVDINPPTPCKKGTRSKFVAMDKVEPFTRKIAGFAYRDFSGGSKFRNGDTLLARITPCLENGKTAFVDILDEAEVGAGSTEFIVLRAKEGVTDPDYVFYLAISTAFRAHAIQSMIGTSGRQRVQTDALARYEFELPDIVDQREIGEQLRVIDSKIDLNREMNATLEQIGEAIFLHDFVTNPEGRVWSKRSLGEFFPVKTGKKDANFGTPDGQYPFFTCSRQVSKAPSYSFSGAALLLAGNGDFNVKYYRGKFEAYQRTYVLIPVNEKLLGFLYFLVKIDLAKVTSGSRGSVIKFITKGMIENYEVRAPKDEQLQELSAPLNQVTFSIEQNNEEAQNLGTLRDALLSNLISVGREVAVKGLHSGTKR